MADRARLIDGGAIGDRIRREAREGIAELKRRGVAVRVAAVLASQEPAAGMYVGRQCRWFTEAGIECLARELTGEVTEARVMAAVAELNEDPRITGIVLALPLPAGISVRRVQESILPVKDVEGVHPHNLGVVLVGRERAGPCTAQAVMEVLEATGEPVRGREAVVVGHSEIVGKPAALALMDRLATVTVCHVATRDLGFHTRRAEILVVAVGKPGLITGDMVRSGAVVIDVGINRVTDAAGKPCTVGDVDFASVVDRAGWITPVPGGVGPVTVAVLLRSAVRAATRHVA
jgi:methylenetetrahydrofolate dehydrogenase (NADP+)/methenyltetrahydrofolate cyclohydrolase